MNKTLVTYESPAARHMIDDWMLEQQDNIVDYGKMPDGRESVKLSKGEVLYMVPIKWTKDGWECFDDLRYTLDASHAGGWRYRKWLHFGRMPLDLGLLGEVLEAVHERHTAVS